MAIEVKCRGLWHKMPFPEEECKEFISSICVFYAIEDISLEILICNDKESRHLNKQYLCANSPTNVLSFPSDEQKSSFIGSLALSIDTFSREAFLYQQDKTFYAKQLLLHGFAHLLGYDHGAEMDDFCAVLDRLY